MHRVISVSFWVFVALSCLVCWGIAAILWVLTTPFDRDRRINHLFSCAWAYLYVRAYPGWRIQVVGRRKIQHGRPYVLIANHTSVADIALCFCLFRQFKWVSKASVFKTPFLGWNMRFCRYIPLERGSGPSIHRMMQLCRSWLDRGISIMMFPEGTRSPDGRLRDFKHGAFTLALDKGVSVIPIAIHGGHQLIPKHGRTFAASARLLVEVLDPIAPQGFDTPEALSNAARNAILQALAHSPFESTRRLAEDSRKSA